MGNIGRPAGWGNMRTPGGLACSAAEGRPAPLAGGETPPALGFAAGRDDLRAGKMVTPGRLACSAAEGRLGPVRICEV